MAVSEKDVLTLAVRLPVFPRQSIGRPADTVLGVIIFVGIFRRKIQGVTRKHQRRGELDALRVHGCIIFSGSNECRPCAVKIVES